MFTFKSVDSSHSYVVRDFEGKITSIVEKPFIPPSDHAVSGVYYFPNGRSFLDSCRLICLRASSEELYVSSALAHMIADGDELYSVDMPTAILGTPEDFQRFEVALACVS